MFLILEMFPTTDTNIQNLSKKHHKHYVCQNKEEFVIKSLYKSELYSWLSDKSLENAQTSYVLRG